MAKKASKVARVPRMEGVHVFCPAKKTRDRKAWETQAHMPFRCTRRQNPTLFRVLVPCHSAKVPPKSILENMGGRCGKNHLHPEREDQGLPHLISHLMEGFKSSAAP